MSDPIRDQQKMWQAGANSLQAMRDAQARSQYAEPTMSPEAVRRWEVGLKIFFFGFLPLLAIGLFVILIVAY